MIVANRDQVRPVEELTFRVEGPTHDLLLHDWLAELLYAFQGRHLLLPDFDVRLEPGRLTATARGEPIDPARHEIDTESRPSPTTA